MGQALRSAEKQPGTRLGGPPRRGGDAPPGMRCGPCQGGSARGLSARPLRSGSEGQAGVGRGGFGFLLAA
eukprot:12130606-Alexandrium_andersonii.AAC.1